MFHQKNLIIFVKDLWKEIFVWTKAHSFNRFQGGDSRFKNNLNTGWKSWVQNASASSKINSDEGAEAIFCRSSKSVALDPTGSTASSAPDFLVELLRRLRFGFSWLSSSSSFSLFSWCLRLTGATGLGETVLAQSPHSRILLNSTSLPEYSKKNNRIELQNQKIRIPENHNIRNAKISIT